jgi:type II restriction enzyme
MNLAMDVRQAEGFKSQAQIARVVSEDWATGNLYCPACASDELTRAPNNTKVFDFTCPRCVARFQLKSSRRWTEHKIPDAGYNAMMEAISTNNNPNLFILHYGSNWTVQNLFLIPSFFLSGSAIQKRSPLAPTARRAGWIGCNILLSNIPSAGRIAIVVDGHVVDQTEVRRKYLKTRPFATLGTKIRGWTLDVFRIIDELPQEFKLSDVYDQEERLVALHPRNMNIRPKIRQRLQALRDMGMIRFLGAGRYLRA